MAITKDVMMGKTLRKSFAKQDQILEIPNMLKIQKDSYEWFLRRGSARGLSATSIPLPTTPATLS